MRSLKVLLVAFIFLPVSSFSQDRTLECSTTYDTLLGLHVVDFPESDPQFPGGEVALREYIKAHLAPQDTAPGNPTYGVVEFVIDPTGRITGLTVPGKNFTQYTFLDRSIMKIVLQMPNWTPGTCNGNNVAVRVRLPVTLPLE